MADGNKRGGGPKTPEGKAQSRGNATKHGLCAKQQKLTPDETAEQYEEHSHRWNAALDPTDFVQEQLMNQLILNHWLTLRANRRYLQVEAADGGEDQHQVELMQRYKTTAERAFYRSWGAVRQMKSDLLKFQSRIMQLERSDGEKDAQIEVLKKELSGRKPEKARQDGPAQARGKKAGEQLDVMEQWAEIRPGADGKTTVELHPSNEELRKEAAKREKAPDLVYRRFHFVGAVPVEYAWTTNDPATAAAGGMGTQRMTWERWNEQVAMELMSADGRLQPCGGNLPRPLCRGGCECPVCTGNRWMMKAAGLE